MLYPFELRALSSFALHTELLFTNVSLIAGRALGRRTSPRCIALVISSIETKLCTNQKLISFCGADRHRCFLRYASAHKILDCGADRS